MKDAHNGKPNEMQQKHNDLDAGFRAFQDALKPQEGQFMRGATYIMNAPKDLSDKPARREATSTGIARKLMERNPDGTWKKEGE